jgi:hypothetical protein
MWPCGSFRHDYGWLERRDLVFVIVLERFSVL